jgi:hypothetical protein
LRRLIKQQPAPFNCDALGYRKCAKKMCESELITGKRQYEFNSQ